MSEAYQVRRNDKVMATGRAADLLARGFAGRLATVGADGWAYVIRLPYVCIDNEIWVHNTAARGHLRANGTRRAGVLRRRGRRGLESGCVRRLAGVVCAEAIFQIGRDADVG